MNSPRLERVRAGGDHLFSPIWAIYERAFSRDARRERTEVEERLSLESFCLEAIIFGNEVAGFIESWDIHGASFIEHLAVREDLRGRGLGRAALELHLSNRPRAIVEVDRESPTTSRILRFYSRIGFEVCDILYVQPPYSPEKPSLPMWLMTYPRALAREEASSFIRRIYSMVYGVRVVDAPPDLPESPLEFERWLGDWERGETPWAGDDADRALFKHYADITARFGIHPESRAFVPLCGDSPAVAFLHQQGHSVTALDFVPAALYSLAARLGPLVRERRDAGYVAFAGERLELVLADIFAYEGQPFDLIYDRAALIAVAPSKRQAYARKLADLLSAAGVIVIDARELAPPDFSRAPYPITRREISELFPGFQLTEIATTKVVDIPLGMIERGVSEITKTFSVLSRTR